MKRTAIVTMSFRDDFKECGLLCRSIDLFVPGETVHYILVPDKDYRLFQAYRYGQHKILKESDVLPGWLVRLPFKVAGRRFHVSPFTYPVRGWIVQQICKLGIFGVIDDGIDAVFNCDSESVFVRPFHCGRLMKYGNYPMYRFESSLTPGHEDFCRAAGRFLRLRGDDASVSRYDYITELVCFERENTTNLLAEIAANNLFGSWKTALCNTKRFSEYYLYGMYVGMKQGGRNHFVTDKPVFRQIPVDKYNGRELFEHKIEETLQDTGVMGLWLQKTSRRKLSRTYLDFDIKKNVLESVWKTTMQPCS